METRRAYVAPAAVGTALPPQVAGGFYPADQSVLARTVDQLLAAATALPTMPKAIIAPHAGYAYSGAVAAAIYKQIQARAGALQRVVIAGPSHRTPLIGAAVPTVDAMMTPLGAVRIDRAAVDQLVAAGLARADDVPFQNEHALETQLPFLQRLTEDVAVVPVLIGRGEPDKAAAILDALWGGDETLIVVSSDLSHFFDDTTARTLDDEATAAIETLNPGALQDRHACGHMSVRALLAVARRRDLRATALDLRNSAAVTGDTARVVGYGAYLFEPTDRARLPPAMAEALLNLARITVIKGAGLPAVPRIEVKGVPRPLLARRAAFVTIRRHGQLRGCRGSVVPHRALLADVIHNAWDTANRDPRFPAITPAELKECDIAISILSIPAPLPVASEADLLAKIRPGEDGLILSDGPHRGLFLPAVWDQLADPAAFVSGLKRKAGLPQDHWSPTVRIERFSAEKIGPVGLG